MLDKLHRALSDTHAQWGEKEEKPEKRRRRRKNKRKNPYIKGFTRKLLSLLPRGWVHREGRRPVTRSFFTFKTM